MNILISDKFDRKFQFHQNLENTKIINFDESLWHEIQTSSPPFILLNAKELKDGIFRLLRKECHPSLIVSLPPLKHLAKSEKNKLKEINNGLNKFIINETDLNIKQYQDMGLNPTIVKNGLDTTINYDGIIEESKSVSHIYKSDMLYIGDFDSMKIGGYQEYGIGENPQIRILGKGWESPYCVGSTNLNNQIASLKWCNTYISPIHEFSDLPYIAYHLNISNFVETSRDYFSIEELGEKHDYQERLKLLK